MASAIQRHGVTLVCTMLGLAVGIGIAAHYYRKGQVAPPYAVSFSYSKIPITAPEVTDTDRLRLYVSVDDPDAAGTPANNQPPPILVGNLVAVKVTVRNSGPKPVRRSDYDSPLVLTTKPGARLLSARLGDCSRADLAPKLTRSVDQSVEIESVVLEADDHFSLDAIIADDPRPGTQSPPLVLSGHIVGVTDYALHTTEKPEESHPGLLLWSRELLFVGVALAVIVGSAVIPVLIEGSRSWLRARLGIT